MFRLSRASARFISTKVCDPSSSYLSTRTFDFRGVTVTSAETPTELEAERDDVIVRAEQRREDCRVGAVEFVAVIFWPDVQRWFAVEFHDATDVLVILNSSQNPHAFRHDGPVFLFQNYDLAEIWLTKKRRHGARPIPYSSDRDAVTCNVITVRAVARMRDSLLFLTYN